MKLSKQNSNLILAHNKGYRVNKVGEIVGLKGNILKPSKSPSGYLSVTMKTLENKTTRLYLHKLQAYQLFGDKMFTDGLVIRHKDGNKLNNQSTNILLGTLSESMLNISDVVRVKMNSKPKHDHEAIIKDRKNGMSYKQLMDKYKISSKGTLSFIINKALKNNE
jgi:hypothetical protein